MVDDQKNTVIAMLSRRKARHVIHRDGFPRSTGGRKRSIEALLLDGRFGNGTSSVGLDVLPDILSKVRTIEIFFAVLPWFSRPRNSQQLDCSAPPKSTWHAHLKEHKGVPSDKAGHPGGENWELAYPPSVAEFSIPCVEKQPIEILVPTRVEHSG